jgi:hypothetical protein
MKAVTGTEINTEDPDHAPSDAPTFQQDSGDLIWLLDDSPATTAAYSHCFRSATFNEIRREERRANHNSYAAQTDSKATERSRRVR